MGVTGTSGSVRGALGNRRSYRDQSDNARTPLEHDPSSEVS